MTLLKNFIKKKFILIGSLSLLLGLFYYYIFLSTSNIAYQDQFAEPQINLITKYFEGNLSFEDVWQIHNGHRMLAYDLIKVANVIFFKYNTQIEMFLTGIFLLLASVFLYQNFKKNFSTLPEKIIQILFIPTAIIIFSLNQWENFVFSMGLANIMPIPFIILSFIILEKIFLRDSFKLNSKLTYYFIFLTILTVLFFGTGGSIVFVLTLILATLTKILIEKKLNRTNIKILLLVLAACLPALYIYFNGTDRSDPTINQGINYIIFNLADSIKFIILSFSGSVLGYDYILGFKNFLNIELNLLIPFSIGTLVFFYYIYAIKTYISLKIQKKSYLPVFLILFSFISIALVLLTRYYYGINYGMSSRYTTYSQFGIIGIFWIMLYAIYYEKEKSKKIFSKKTAAIFILTMIICGQILTYSIEFAWAPYRKTFYKNLEQMALNYENYTTDQLANGFQYRHNEQVIKALATLKQYKLNVFSK